MSYKINLEGKKEGDIVKEQVCKGCGITLVKRAIPDTYKGGLKASAFLDEQGNPHIERKGSDYFCKATGKSITGKSQNIITDDPNNTSNIHVDSHSHADLNKGIHELKEMISEVIKELKTVTEREKQ